MNIENIKDKKELRDLDEGFLKNIISKYNDFKEIRKDLRKVYGMFKGVKYNRDDKVYDLIFEKTGKPKKVLDLGCGYSPLHFPFKDIKYYCADIGNDYVKDKGFIFDLIHDDYNRLPKVDVVFLFRVLESLEFFKRNVSKEVISRLKCKYVIVSFDKKSLSGKGIKKKGRVWFRRILEGLGLEYEIFDYGNEIFFIIKK
tara:strand:- start:1178 stop:1774 length:597 start_codon:yes stop_codon:yes gene_type:complete